MGRSPKKQKESPATIAARERQLADLAKLDEEQNAKIKSMFLARNGARAFRAPTALKIAGDSAGVAGNSAAPSTTPPGSLFRRLRRAVSGL